MSSADGTALDGMYHEEHALPAFVHGRSRDQLKLPQMFLKGETPVIYFYTKEKQNVRVGVGFPRGIWTQWYPQAAAVLPEPRDPGRAVRRAQGRADLLVRRSGSSLGDAACQQQATRLPRPSSINMLPETSSDALWNHAREVDAAFVKSIDGTRSQPADEYEKFLFYRGLGEARLPLHIQESGQGTLTLDSELDLGDGVRDIFVLRVEGGRGAYTYRPALRPGEIVERRDPLDGSRHSRWPSSPRRSATIWPRGSPSRAFSPRKPGRWSTPGKPATSRPREFACCSSCRSRGPMRSSR